MDRAFKTPLASTSRMPPSTARASAIKRDSITAGLERDPELSTAKRKQRTQAFTSHMAQASLERQLVSAQTAKLELETKLRERDATIERLESDRRYLAEREKEEREEKERERAGREEEKRKSDSDIRALRNSYMALREQYVELEDAHSSLSRDTAQIIATQKAEISTLTRQLDVLQLELRDTKGLVEQRDHALDNLQQQLDGLSAAQDVSRASIIDEESWSVVREELHRQTDYLRTVEVENAKLSSEIAILKQRHENVEMLREQKRELEWKVRDAGELREQVARLEGELAASKHERDELASKQTESQTPVTMTQALSSLRVQYATLLDEHSQTAAQLRSREVELIESQREAQEAQDLSSKFRAERDSLRDKAERHAHRAQLAEREVKFLRSMVASFTSEEASQEGLKVEELSSQRIEHLELLVTEYQLTISEMEKRIEDLGGDSPALTGGRLPKQLVAELDAEKAAKLAVQQALEEAQAEIEEHVEKIEELEQKMFDLQGETGGGRHVPPGVRVLSLRDNPAQQWADLSQAAMDRLKGENEALLKRLKELEESGASAGHAGPQEELVPRESWEVVNKEKAKLEEELKQKEKRLLRLRQVFTAKTDEFKQAITSILGVKLAFYPNGQVRVTSTFDLNTAFVFQPTNAADGEGVKMQLIAQSEGGPEDLPQLMRYWIEQEQCMPGFLASITLQCYEKRKMEEEPGHVA